MITTKDTELKVFRIYDPMDTEPTSRPIEEVMKFKDLRKGDVFASKDMNGEIVVDDFKQEWFRATSDSFIDTNNCLAVEAEGMGFFMEEIEIRVKTLL